jgi:hypothetical protein
MSERKEYKKGKKSVWKQKGGSKHDGSMHKLLVEKSNGVLESASVHAQSIHNMEEKVNPAPEVPIDSVLRGVTEVKEPLSYPTVMNTHMRRFTVLDWEYIHYKIVSKWSTTRWVCECLIMWPIYTMYMLLGQWHWVPVAGFDHEIATVNVPSDLLSSLNIWWAVHSSHNYNEQRKAYRECYKYAAYYMEHILDVHSKDLPEIIKGAVKYTYPIAYQEAIEEEQFLNLVISEEPKTFNWQRLVWNLIIYFIIIKWALS